MTAEEYLQGHQEMFDDGAGGGRRTADSGALAMTWGGATSVPRPKQKAAAVMQESIAIQSAAHTNANGRAAPGLHPA